MMHEPFKTIHRRASENNNGLEKPERLLYSQQRINIAALQAAF